MTLYALFFITISLKQDAETGRQLCWKVKAQVEAEKKVWTSLNLNLDLSLFQQPARTSS
jgi:hypothetical protein